MPVDPERHITAETKETNGKFDFYRKGHLESMELKFSNKTIRMLSLEPLHPGEFPINTLRPTGDGYETPNQPTISEMLSLYKEAHAHVPEERLTKILYGKIRESIETVKANLNAQIKELDGIRLYIQSL